MKSPSLLRHKFQLGQHSVGTWMQISSPEIAEIFAANNLFDWVVVDDEHGCFNSSVLPSICRSIELHGKLPFIRLKDRTYKSARDVAEFGFSGFIVPMVESAKDLLNVFNAINYPPLGTRGVGFCRSNQYGINFNSSFKQDSPFLVSIIESALAVQNLDSILQFKHLDAIMVGPYDLSTSLSIPGEFDNPLFTSTLATIREKCRFYNVPFGQHIVSNDKNLLDEAIINGSKFIVYSMDSVMLSNPFQIP
ncbi:HpcH/HpaI aldolase/citrate lyase family protein [Synechococcus sp. RS9916]|uniref:HpcH/HpaI aldolase family protein n=1 Tax=Synechococcus sp. RS9916 TaxID=221359 RepID=UPI0000E538E2|nr:aldolase/citrate lyase family protein [Synechococcus sp. RS9916]EAU75558.1 HPCH/HPAI aldolase family protein [Synechococcus sp. RS9916]